MNILYIPSWFVSRKRPNNGIYFYEQAIALSKICDKLFVVYPAEIEFKRKFLKDEKNIYFFPFPKIHYKKTYFFNFFLNYFIKKIHRKYGKIDLIHAQSFLWAGIESSKIVKKYNIPLIITEHHSRFLVGKEDEKIKNLIVKTLNVASKVIFVSSALSKSFINQFFKYLKDENSYLSKFITIPNSLRDDFFELKFKNKNQNDLLVKNRISNHRFIFSSISNLKETKGIDFLLRSFNKAFKNTPYIQDTYLLIGGEGPERKKIEKQIIELNLQDNIRLLGQLNRLEVEQLLESTSCFLLASKFETFGIVIIEALAKGVPVITTDSGGPADIINEDCGIIVKERDVEIFADAIFYVYNNPNRYNKTKIRQFAFENFSETAFCDKYKKIYEDLIDAGLV